MKYIFITALTYFLLSCSSSENSLKDTKDINVFIYMAADNNLYKNALKNIKDMEKNKKENMNVIVYLDSSEGYSVIYEIEPGKNSEKEEIESKIIASYNKDNSADSKTLKKFLKLCFENYNAKETGIILWSHGSGFLPPEYEENKTRNIVNFSFALDNKSRMNIKDMANVLNEYKSDFIIFDACYMADIETIYEIKNASKYILASQTEVLAEGYPYFEILNILNEKTSTEEKLKNTAKAFFNYYYSNDIVSKRSASVSLIRTSSLENLKDSFISFYKETLNKHSKEVFTKYLELTQESSDSALYKNQKYDLKDWAIKIKENYADINAESFINNFNISVIYETNTEYMFSTFSIEHCSGLNFYIPYKKEDLAYEYYKNTLWANETKFYEIF